MSHLIRTSRCQVEDVQVPNSVLQSLISTSDQTRRIFPSTALIVLFSFLAGMAACGGSGDKTPVQPTPLEPSTAPSNLVYSQARIRAMVGSAITPDYATYAGTLSSFRANPALPAGLTINAGTGTISGTPLTAAAAASYRVTAANIAGSTTAELVIEVVAAGPPYQLSYPQSVIAATVGHAIDPLTPNVIGPVTSFAINPALPIGLQFDTSTGAISGTPESAQTSTEYTVTATNDYGSSLGQIWIVVRDAPLPNLIYPQTTIAGAIGITIVPDSPNSIGTAFSFSIVPTLPAGLTLDASTGMISGTPTTASAATAYTVTAINTVRTVSATLQISVSQSGSTAPGIYVFDNNSDFTGVRPPFNIYQFAKTATGSVTPNKILTGPDNLIATAVAIDKSGRFYIAVQEMTGLVQSGLKVLVFNAGARGTPAADKTIDLRYTGHAASINAMTVDDDRNLYIYIRTLDRPYGETLNEEIVEYVPQASGTYTPTRKIAGPATTVANIRQIAVDSSGSIYAANQGTSSILIFNSTSDGNTAPTATLASASPFTQPTGVAVDLRGNIYVAASPSGIWNTSGSSVLPLTVDLGVLPALFVFGPGSTGVAVPIRIVVWRHVAILDIGNLALDASGETYLSLTLFTSEDLPQDPEIFKVPADMTGYDPASKRIQPFPIFPRGISVY